MLKRWAEWTANSASEVDFWTRWITTRGLKWPADYASRIDPAQPLPHLIEDQLQAAAVPKGAAVRILDIGSGPLTYVGSASQSYKATVVAVDPLADDYNRILRDRSVAAPNLTIKGFAETLDRQFEADSFDAVWCCNALDHAFDPILGISKMLTVVKGNCPVILLFHPNEADGGNYEGLHQWNFDLSDNGDFTIEQRGQHINITKLVSDQVAVKSWAIGGVKAPKSRIAVVFRKTTDFSLTQLLLKAANP